MCNALEELRQEGVEEGRKEGRQEGRWEGILEGIRATVRTCRNFHISETDTVRNIMNEFSLSQEEAVNYVKKILVNKKKDFGCNDWSLLFMNFNLVRFHRAQNIKIVLYPFGMI